MKKFTFWLFIFLLTGFLTTSTTSCKTAYGCPAEEHYEKSLNQELSTKRGKSSLFSKKQQKKMRTRS